MNSRISASSAGSADSVWASNPSGSEQFAFASLTPNDSGTCGITGPECPSSAMSTTLTPSVELWSTPKTPEGGNRSRGHDRKDELLLNGQAEAHSSSPLAFPASLPLPPASAKAVEMTVGSGRRLSGWLSDSGPAGACLKILLESRAWRSPLRSLAWTLLGYGKCPDEPSLKSSRDLALWDTNCLATGTGFPGFRLCRLRVLELSTDGTGFSSSPAAEMWGTPTTRDHKDTGVSVTNGSVEPNGLLARQAQLWTTPCVRDANTLAKVKRGKGSTEKGNELIQPIGIQAAFQTGATPESNREPMASGGQLNPAFVCYLMGYPAGFLSYEGSATRSSRKLSRKSAKPSSKRKE